MRSCRRSGRIAPVVFVMVLLSGCVSLCRAEETVKIGVIFSKSGIFADRPSEYALVRMAVDEVNARGGVLGRMLEIIEFDDRSTALGAKKSAEQAVQMGVTAVIGASRSSYALAIAPVVQEAKIPMVLPIVTNSKITRVGDYIFRVCFPDTFQAAVMAQFAEEYLRAKRVVVLVNVNSDYSMDLARMFVQNATANGLKILWKGNYGETMSDFTSLIEKVAYLAPDVIYLPGYPRESGLIIKQIRKRGLDPVFIGGDRWDETLYEYSDNEVVGSYCIGHWYPRTSSYRGRTLQAEYLQRYGRKLEHNDPLIYDAVMLLADAIERAGSFDREKIRDALAATSGFKGVAGTVTFDAHGDPLHKEAVVLRFEKKGLVPVKAVSQ